MHKVPRTLSFKNNVSYFNQTTGTLIASSCVVYMYMSVAVRNKRSITLQLRLDTALAAASDDLQ